MKPPKPDGGPAFPRGGRDMDVPYADRMDVSHTGMTLRDYFAAAALQGMLASDSSVDRTKVNKAIWAKIAYAFADALLAEREKR